jgi:hypothetical protein
MITSKLCCRINDIEVRTLYLLFFRIQFMEQVKMQENHPIHELLIFITNFRELLIFTNFFKI